MCDYSLHHVASRPAKVRDKLVTTELARSSARGFAAVGEESEVAILARGHQGSGQLLGHFRRGADDGRDRDLGRTAEQARGAAQETAAARAARTAAAACQKGKRQAGERHRCGTPEPAAHVTCVRALQNSPSVGRTAPLATDMS